MRDVYICGVMFALLALWLGWQMWIALQTGEIVSKYGTRLSRKVGPRRFGFMIGVYAVFTALAILTSGYCFFFSPLRSR